MTPLIRELEWGHTTTGLCYEVELPTVGHTTIVCSITVPSAAIGPHGQPTGRFPAIIAMPGYGAEQPPMDRTADGLITLSANPRHHGPSRRF